MNSSGISGREKQGMRPHAHLRAFFEALRDTELRAQSSREVAFLGLL